MRLHNRQVKATFWTDTELIRLLDIPGRMFYQGLWQIADDSGCLDHDYLAFKMLLFPVDTVSIEQIEAWTKKLIDAGKLIPYTAQGKECLYLKNFHKHQSLKNCSSPDVPLPPWIKWEPYTSNERAGKYVVSLDVLTDFLQSSDGVLTDALQVSSNLTKPNLTKPNQEPNHNLTKNDDDDRAPARQNFVVVFEQEFGRTPTPSEFELLKSYLEDGMEEDVICEAIRRAALNGVRKTNYVKSILNNLISQQVLTMADLERADFECEQAKNRNKQSRVRSPAETKMERNLRTIQKALLEDDSGGGFL